MMILILFIIFVLFISYTKWLIHIENIDYYTLKKLNKFYQFSRPVGEENKFKIKYMKNKKLLKTLKEKYNKLSNKLLLLENLSVSPPGWENWLNLSLHQEKDDIEEKISHHKSEMILQSIIDQCKKSKCRSISKIFRSNKTFQFNKIYLLEDNVKDCYQVITRRENKYINPFDQEKVKYICKEDVLGPIHDYYKLIMYKNDRTLNECKLGDLNTIHSKSFCHFKIRNLSEAMYLIQYYNTKLPNVILQYNIKNISKDKNSYSISSRPGGKNHYLKKEIFNNIPLVPLNREWNDELVYKYFNFDKEQIKVINEYSNNK